MTTTIATLTIILVTAVALGTMAGAAANTSGNETWSVPIAFTIGFLCIITAALLIGSL